MTLRNWRGFGLVQYFRAKISMNFWIKGTQGYVFIRTPTHNTKSKHLCLLLTGRIFNHSLLLASVNRMNVTVGLTRIPQKTRASVSSRPRCYSTYRRVYGGQNTSRLLWQLKLLSSDWELRMHVVVNTADSCSVPLGCFPQDCRGVALPRLLISIVMFCLLPTCFHQWIVF